MYKLLFLFLVPVCGGQVQVGRFDGEKLDQRFSHHQNALNESLGQVNRAILNGNLVLMVRSAVVAEEHLSKLAAIQEDCAQLAQLLRSRAQQEYRTNKINRDEYFNLLALASKLNKHSKFSFDHAQRQLRVVVRILKKMYGENA